MDPPRAVKCTDDLAKEKPTRFNGGSVAIGGRRLAVEGLQGRKGRHGNGTRLQQSYLRLISATTVLRRRPRSFRVSRRIVIRRPIAETLPLSANTNFNHEFHHDGQILQKKRSCDSPPDIIA